MTREEARNALIRAQNRLGRRPKKADFSPEETAKIKAALGPWPRALEAAGLKPPSPQTRHERTVMQRRSRKIAARPAEGKKKGNEHP